LSCNTNFNVIRISNLTVDKIHCNTPPKAGENATAFSRNQYCTAYFGGETAARRYEADFLSTLEIKISIKSRYICVLQKQLYGLTGFN